VSEMIVLPINPNQYLFHITMYDATNAEVMAVEKAIAGHPSVESID